MCHLYTGTIVWRRMQMQDVLRHGRSGIVKMFDGPCHKMGPWKGGLCLCFSPVKVDLDIFAACVINRDNIMFFEGVNEVVGLVARGVLDPKIVKDRGELDWSSGVFP